MLMSLKRLLVTPSRRGAASEFHITPPVVDDIVGAYEADLLTPGELTTWNDTGPVGSNHITQATASKRPDVVEMAIDGRKAVQFAGDLDIDTLVKTTPTLNAPTGITMHCVAKMTSLATSYPMMLVGAAAQCELRFVETFEQPQSLGDTLGVDVCQPAASPGTYLNKWHQYTLTFDPALDILRIFVDGTVANELSTADSALPFDVIRMGARDDTSNAFIGLIAEALFYRIALTSGQVGSLADQYRIKFPSLPGGL